MPRQKLISTGDLALDKAKRREAIIAQVDYWFSKENLITDDNLRDELIGCKYGKNDEVPLTKINWWRAMRNCFQTKCGMNSQNTNGRKEIMEALKDSTTVDIVGPELVRRKVPFTMDPASHRGAGPANGTNGTAGQNGVLVSSSNGIAPSNEAAATDEEEGEDSEDGAWTAADKEKLFVQLDLRKNKKKMSDATGFEERFADAPLTTAEYNENQECYNPARDPHDRIEVAIQRYKGRRKFHSSHLQVFNTWLKFGGVETGERRFGGPADKDALAGMSAFDKAVELATHHVGEDKADEKQWVIDFQGVAKAYLSSAFPRQFFDPDVDKIHLQCVVMVNFFNYLLHHDVCPEYAKEIKETRNFIIKTKAEQDLEDLRLKPPSKSAEQELIAIHNLGPKFPGEFAVACSVVLGGNLAESHGNGSITWADEKDHTGMSVEKARLVLASAITLFGSPELANVLYPGSELSVDKLDMAEVHRLGLKVIEIEVPNEEVIKYYADMNEFYKMEKKTMSAKPLGKLVCKPWAVPTFEDSDLPKHLRTETFRNPPDIYTFWLEGEILQEVFVGMKMSAEVRRLVGQGCEESVWVLDGVNSLYCSFYSLILNELMPHPHKEVRLLTAEEQAAEAADGDDMSGL